MSNYKFLCDHCGKNFELVTPEAGECPFCFWSSSVKRADEAEAEKKQITSPGENKDPIPQIAPRIIAGLMLLLKALFFMVLLGGVGFLGYQLFAKWSAQKDQPGVSISAKDTHKVRDEAASPDVLMARLSGEEKAALSREAPLPEKIEPSDAEKKVLDRMIAIKTGWIEKLPSPAWTLEQYEQMIAEQEKFYKITFARSYKKKLEELFKAKYLAAADAFAKADPLAARNLWVESLAFPLYSEDLMKHRAVALTMLKPFINDTLAKIGALNQSLVTKEKREKEGAFSAAYQNLSGLLTQQKWADAAQAIDQMGPLLDQLNAAAKQPAVPPSYPAGIATVDQDIQRALADLLAPNPVSVADFLSVKQDLAEKRDVLTGLTGDQVQVGAEAYRNALAMIREERWGEALSMLNRVQAPSVLRDDAQAKAAILQKVVGQGLDPSGRAD